MLIWMRSRSVRFPALGADAPFALVALDKVPLAASDENSLRLKGLHGALAALNATTPYRLTGVYRFDGGMVRSVALFDRKNPHLTVGVDVPWQDSYCRLTAENGGRCEIVDAPHDAASPRTRLEKRCKRTSRCCWRCPTARRSGPFVIMIFNR